MSASEDDKPSGYIENGMTRSEAMEMYLELELRGKRWASRTAGIGKEGGALLSDRPPCRLPNGRSAFSHAYRKKDRAWTALSEAG
jgi:hypothetical protein